MSRNKKDKYIEDFLVGRIGSNGVSFHMPGHKGGRIFRETGHEEFINNLAKIDITEIPGADNLFQPRGIIENTQKRYEKLYGAKKSYLLVNGSSGGIIAAVLAAIKPGGKLLMARNSHKAVYNAVELGRIIPEYAYPKMLEKSGICGAITPAEISRCFEEIPDIEGVILTSPNYYGILSDIKEISEIVHEKGKILIVDQAHGAHLKFFGDISAENLGADIVINSVHKTMASFTQSGVLNICSDRVKLKDVEDALQKIESSSPSYMLMGALDINGDICEKHKELFVRWQENLDFIYDEINKMDMMKTLVEGEWQEECCSNKDAGDNQERAQLDPAKIGITVADGEGKVLPGVTLFKILNDEYKITCELYTENHVFLETGIGNTREDFTRLAAALRGIEEKIKGGEISLEERKPLIFNFVKHESRYEFGGVAKSVSIKKSSGKICAENIIPYPPGIPLICKGEIISNEDVEYIVRFVSHLKDCDGSVSILGIKDGEILVY